MASLKDLTVLGPARFLDKLYGNLEGNASTADKLKTVRSISLSGDLSGSASFDGSANITITATVADNSHNHHTLIGWSDTRDVTTSPNDYNAKLKVVGIKTKAGSGITFDSAGEFATLLGIRGWGNNSGGQAHELAFDASGELYHRYGQTTTWNSWKKIAYTDSSITGNASTATKLQTARTINGTSFDGTGNITTSYWGTARDFTIGNTGKSVNGSGDISWSIAEIGAVNKTGDTMTGDLSFKTTNFTSTPVAVKDDGTTYGHTLLVGAGGTTYVGAGESASTLYFKLAVKSTEDLILGADSNIRFHTGADSATTTNGITLNTSNQFYPQTNNAGSLGTSGYKWGGIYSNKGYFGGTSTTDYALNTNSFICDSWIRSKGDTGWYNETHGGGWHMTDTTWIRAYNGKSVYVSNTSNSAIYTSGAVRGTKGFTVDETMAICPEINNEINFGGTGTSTTIYMGYRAAGSRAIPTKFIFGSSGGTASLQCNTVYLGSGSSYVSSSQYTGNAATATKATQDASSNTITTSYLRRYDWWISGNGNDVDTLRAGITFAYSDHNAPTTGTIVAFDCRGNERYGLQIMGDYYDSANHLHFRNRNGDGNKWGAWRTVLDDNNYTSYTVTKSGSGAFGTWGINIAGNAATATAFSSNRTIALTGDVTGSASTNGSSGWSISTTVADDSHNHIISNVDGLQTALDNKAGGSNYIDITVGGDANTYYPVVLANTASYFPMQFVNISRNFAETAPDSWYNTTHKGGLTMTLLWNGSRYWDGNGSGSPCYCVYLYEIYSTMVGGLGNSVDGIVVWLRGGTATYHIHSLSGKAMRATVYTSTFTDAASNSFAPTTTPATVTVKWPGDITGHAATASSATSATRAQYLESTKKHYANSIYTSGRGNCFCFRQYVNTSSSSTSPTDCTYYEQYNLPIPTAGRSSNVSYTILTSKSKVTVAQGGTGTGSTGAGSGQALYNLGLVYSTTEPTSPTTGMVWLCPA